MFNLNAEDLQEQFGEVVTNERVYTMEELKDASCVKLRKIIHLLTGVEAVPSFKGIKPNQYVVPDYRLEEVVWVCQGSQSPNRETIRKAMCIANSARANILLISLRNIDKFVDIYFSEGLALQDYILEAFTIEELHRNFGRLRGRFLSEFGFTKSTRIKPPVRAVRVITESDLHCKDPERLVRGLKKVLRPECYVPELWEAALNEVSSMKCADWKDIIDAYLNHLRIPGIREEFAPFWCRSWEHINVAHWAYRNRNSRFLYKPVDVYGPRGRHSVSYYVDRLDEIMPEDLINGIKTSPKVAFERASERIERELIRMYKREDKPLPPCPMGDKPDFVQIKSSHALMDEGEVMDHCVGSYVGACTRSDVFIYHLAPEGNEGATCELFLRDGYLRIVQLRGYSNCAVTDEELEKVEGYVDEFNTTY